MSAKGTRCPQERGVVWSELWSETAGHPNPPPSIHVDVIDAQRGLEKGQAGPGSLLGSRASWRFAPHCITLLVLFHLSETHACSRVWHTYLFFKTTLLGLVAQ